MVPILLVVHPHVDCGGWRWAVQVGSRVLGLRHCANAGWSTQQSEALTFGHESYDAAINALQHVSINVDPSVLILNHDPTDQYGDEIAMLHKIDNPTLTIDARVSRAHSTDVANDVDVTCGYTWCVWMGSGEITRCVKTGWAGSLDMATLASDRVGAAVTKALRLLGIPAQYQGIEQ